MKKIFLASILALAAACNPPDPAGETTSDAGTTPSDAGSVKPPVDAGPNLNDTFKDAGTPAPELGNGTLASVILTEVAGPAAGLKMPRDLAFNPNRPDELWVVNYTDDSVTLVFNASKTTKTTEWRKDGYAMHFMAEPSSIAFGANETTFGSVGTFATCQESRNTYDNQAAANDFMGPSLWTSDLTVFAKMNPEGLGSHIDMLHEAPLCMGIAHEAGNAYWTFNGFANSITRFDFGLDHNVGTDDHSDGSTIQYVPGLVKYQPKVPSHLAYDAATSMLYIADTGNHRVARLNTKTGTRGKDLVAKEPLNVFYQMDNAQLATIVPESTGDLFLPSGIELHKGLLYVSDNERSTITAFTLEGQKVKQLNLGLPKGSLSGFAFGQDGKIYLVDMVGNRVLRIDPRPNT